MPVVIRDGPRFTLPTGRDVTWRRCAAFDRLVASSPTCPHATRPHLYALYLAVCRPSQATVIYQSLCLKSASSPGSPGGEPIHSSQTTRLRRLAYLSCRQPSHRAWPAALWRARLLDASVRAYGYRAPCSSGVSELKYASTCIPTTSDPGSVNATITSATSMSLNLRCSAEVMRAVCTYCATDATLP